MTDTHSDDFRGPSVDPACLADQSYEQNLEPRHLIRRTEVVLRAGALMLGAGTSSLRVRELMRRVARALGLDGMQASISYTDITLTVARAGIFRTQVAESTTPGVNAHRIAQLQQLSQTLPEPITATELDHKLDEIEQCPPLYPLWMLGVFVGLACVSATLLQNGTWREALAVFPAATLAFWLVRSMAKYQLNHLVGVLLAAVVATGGFTIFTRALDLAFTGPSVHMSSGFIGVALFLVPGFPLVTGGLDLTRIDLTAGIPRVVYAMLVLICITIGVWVVAGLSGVAPGISAPLALPVWGIWLVRVLASFGAVFGWAIMFNSPMKSALVSGTVAVIGNVPRLLMMDAGIANHVATYLGCIIIGLVCAAAGWLFGLEKIIMTVPTLLVVIPGASALHTMLYFDSANTALALTNGISTVLVVVAMVGGLATARMLTDPEWTFTRPDAPSVVSVVKQGSWRIKTANHNQPKQGNDC